MRPLGPGFEDLADALPRQPGAAFAEWREALDDPLREQLLLVVAANLSLAAQVPVVLPIVEEELVEGAHVARPRMAGLRFVCPLDIGDHAQDLFADDVRRIVHADDVFQPPRHPPLATIPLAATS